MADRDHSLPVDALQLPAIEGSRDSTDASLAHFSSRVAHDLNNVWMGIQTFAEVLKRKLQGDEKSLAALGQLLDSVDRGKGLTEELQRIAHAAELQLRTADIRLFATAHGDEWAALCGERRLSLMTDKERMDARIDPVALNEAVTALVRNAVEASADPDPILVDVRRAGDAIEIAVLDHGHGVDEADTVRLFEARFTTRPRHRGTGLFFARRIVRAHGGWIELRPMERGTEAVIVLPAE